jgi:hypothetical protein
MADSDRRYHMSRSRNKTKLCPSCKNRIAEEDDFCPHCGKLQSDGVRCANHKSAMAEGVCIICTTPMCRRCGTWVNKRFLCSDHTGYEIYEGMARVYGVSDEAAAQYVCKCLEQEGLHPLVYERKASAISVGGPDYTLFEASGEFDGHIINEVKVMVPCQEVVIAERALKKVNAKPRAQKKSITGRSPR